MNFTFDSQIAGIPCQIEVEDYTRVKGSFSYHAASDIDYYGYSECVWNVLDRKGYNAKWLEKKLTDKDRQRIDEEIEKEAERVAKYSRF